MEKAGQILKEIMVKLGIEVKLESMKLDDGVTVLEADSFEATKAVNIKTEDKLVPLLVGEYNLEDGRVLTVLEDGVIASVSDGKPVETPEQKPAEGEGDVPLSDKPNVAPVPKKIVEAITKESHFSKEDMDTLSAAIETAVKLRTDKFEVDFKENAVKVELEKAEALRLAEDLDVNIIVPNPNVELKTSNVSLGLMATLNALK